MFIVNRYHVLIVLAAVLFFAGISRSLAYDDPTHRAIATRAVDVSSLSPHLREQLGLTRGIEETFLGRRVDEWIISGALSEDYPVTRVLYHFHNPLQPWNQAGLRVGGQLGQSSLLWNQQRNQTGFLGSGDGSWSWFNARRQYFDALTKASKADREKSFADLFRSLGQGTHLLQDATVPAHVRNDQHLNWEVNIPLIGNVVLGDPDGYEKWAKNNLALAQQRVDQPPIAPATSIFTPTDENQAPSPVARLFDTDRYLGSNFSILSDPALGIAEFTNGNFLSKDTIFRDFALPQRNDLNLANPIVEPIDKRFARFYSKSIGGGETITHFVREGMLWRSIQAATSAPPPSSGWVLDDRVHQDYATSLLPRAVGYSASYLDYFFRGQLDVDVSNDPTDAALIRLEGTNGSTEKLDGGTLELYGEDFKGVRTAATAVGTNIVTVDVGQPISVTFRLPPNSDKFMAVYKGKFGNEAPQGDFIGGVIGKFLNPKRVEQIFTDFTRWYIRSPQGVFPLPLLKAEVDDLQWGDSENMMVGRTRIGPGHPNLIFAYRINRLNGATHIPLTVSNEVDIQTVQQYPFPLGVSTGTNIQFSHLMPYKQYVLWNLVTSPLNWNNPDDPVNGFYLAGTPQITYGVNLVVSETATGNLSYPILLDEQSHLFGAGNSQYLWDVWSIHLTSEGRALALVQVLFSTNNLGRATFPSRTLGRTGGLTAMEQVDLAPVQVPFSLPELGPVWVLVDIASGQVVANTAPSTLVMTHEKARIVYGPNPNQNTPPYRVISQTVYNGGPLDRQVDISAGDGNFQSSGEFCTPQRLNTMNILAGETVGPFHIRTTLIQNRAEIAQAEFGPAPNSPGVNINFPTDCGNDQEPAKGFRITTVPEPAFAPNNVGEFGAGVLRTTPSASTERLVFLMTQAQTISLFSERAKVIAWNPSLSRIDAVQEFNDQGLHALTTASRDAALFVTFGNSNQSRLVDFPAEGVIAFPNQLLFDYALLDPAFLYNTGDFKFHVKDSSLASTGQPLSLAPAPNGNPRERYHVLKAGEPVN